MIQETVYDLLLGEHLVDSGDAVLVAVSGGIDSVVLLHLLHALAPRLPVTLHAAHLDHAIRRNSAEDTAFVIDLCDRLAVQLTTERIDVPALAAAQRTGLEEAGRQARRDFLCRVARQHNCQVIALGHHADDQAETVLHRLLRGSSASGLAGMRLHHGACIRPLLRVTRADIEGYAAEHHLNWCEDVSNRDITFTRNRIRHQLLPQLREFNPRIDRHLVALAERLAVEEDFWSGVVAKHFDRLLTDSRDGLRLSVAGLQALHRGVRRRVLRHALGVVRGSVMTLAAPQIAALERLLHGSSQAELDLPGVWAARRYSELWLRTAAPSCQPFSVIVAGPGIIDLPQGDRLVFSYGPPQGEDPLAVEFSAATLSFPLTIRSFQPGDRLQPAGGAGSRKLKELFIDAKIERERRRSWPLLVGEDILWIPGLRRCDSHWPTPSEVPVLRVAFEPALP
ncbi:MAG: tRNA lysidine(34) synthetase TilS [Desulfuromonadaceae bacterium]|nr:tRNA lysidine(34) synthetase TilS [Desulfuromonadaceae bacterium]